MNIQPRLRVTQDDAIKLSALAEDLSRFPANLEEQAELLRDVLELAEIVPSDDISPEVVTLNSQVLFEDVATAKSQRVTLVLPGEAEPTAGRISVVSPMGRALLGRQVGDLVEVSVPHGQTRSVRLLEIPYQPEAQAQRAARHD